MPRMAIVINKPIKKGFLMSLVHLNCLLILLCSFAANSVLASTELKIAFGNSLPPWVFPDQDNGILVDIARASLQNTGYQMRPVYYPYARRIKAYKNGQVDVVTDMTPLVVAKENLQGYLSERFYYYENVAVSLAENKFEINNVDDLASLRILAWQGAISTLSKEYAKMALENSNYKETYKQKSQVEMLFRKRVDVIQLDTQIFYYYRQQVSDKGRINTKAPVSYAPIFGRNYCAFFFRNKDARDTFNEQIKRLKENEKQYQAIYSQYIKAGMEVE